MREVGGSSPSSPMRHMKALPRERDCSPGGASGNRGEGSMPRVRVAEGSGPGTVGRGRWRTHREGKSSYRTVVTDTRAVYRTIAHYRTPVRGPVFVCRSLCPLAYSSFVEN